MGGFRVTPVASTLCGMEQHHQDGQDGGRRFRIWVDGRLDEQFSNALEGIEQQEVPSGTVLVGKLIDQSRLHSVLDYLRRLGIEVVRFEVDTRRHDATDPTSTGTPEDRQEERTPRGT